MPTYECPTCARVVQVDKASALQSRPFCSERCKMIDLGKWLDGSYTTSEELSPEDAERLDAISGIRDSRIPEPEDPA